MARRIISKKAAIAKTGSGHKLAHSKVVGGKRIYKASYASRATIRSKSTDSKLFTYKFTKSSSLARISVGVIRQKFGVSQEELARVTGYSTRSIAGWESGQKLSDSARQKLTETERLRTALSQIMPGEHLGEWLRNPNPAFEGQAPLQVIERGESDRLWQMIFQLDANVAS